MNMIYGVKDKPKFGQTLIFAIQQLLAIMAATLVVPVIINGATGSTLSPAAALLGGSFVLLCDVLARVLFAPFELPVGIVMSLLGGPFFLYLLLRRKGGRVYA